MRTLALAIVLAAAVWAANVKLYLRPAPVVVDGPLFDAHLQMALTEWDQQVQTLATKAAAEPLTCRVGPGRPDRSSKNPHTQVRHLPVEVAGKDAFPVVDQEAIRMSAWQRLPQLL